VKLKLEELWKKTGGVVMYRSGELRQDCDHLVREVVSKEVPANN
jgi:hypothetical protein